MATGNWDATEAAAVLVPSKTYPGARVVQHYSGDPVYLGIGEEPTVGEGIVISSTFPVYTLSEASRRSNAEIKGICDTGQTANGGYSDS